MIQTWAGNAAVFALDAARLFWFKKYRIDLISQNSLAMQAEPQPEAINEEQYLEEEEVRKILFTVFILLPC